MRDRLISGFAIAATIITTVHRTWRLLAIRTWFATMFTYVAGSPIARITRIGVDGRNALPYSTFTSSHETRTRPAATGRLAVTASSSRRRASRDSASWPSTWARDRRGRYAVPRITGTNSSAAN